MSQIQDSQFKRLRSSVSLSKQSKRRMKHAIMTSHKEKNIFFPKVLSFVVLISVIVFFYIIIANHNKMKDFSQSKITDIQTPEALPSVEISNNMFTIDGYPILWIEEITI